MEPRVSALLLAAGSSRRMGLTKQLLPLGDKPVIRHCIDTLLAAGVPDIVVVAGNEKDGIAHALRGLPVTIAVNAAPGSDMAESARVGLKACDPRSSGVLICLSDHPLVQTQTYRTLIRLHYEESKKIIIPAFKERRGHPSLFPAGIISDIYSMTSLRDIIREEPNRVLLVEVPDEGVILDMDTEPDYRRIRELYDARENVQQSGDSHV